MLNVSQSKSSVFSTPFYYGWIVVFISALGIFFSGPGQTYSNSVFIDYYIRDFGWSRSFVSGIYSMATLTAGLLLLKVGRYVDRYGQRRMSVLIAFMLAVACMWNSVITGPAMLFIGFFLIRLFGQGGMTLVHSTLVPQWFIKQRGRALSFMALGGVISAAAMPPLNIWMIQVWGWQAAWQVWALVLCLAFVPLTYYLIRNRPEDVGLQPDPPAFWLAKDEKSLVNAKCSEFLEENWTLKEAKRTRTFWLILGCAAVPAMVNTGLTFHLVSILGQAGITKTTTAFVLSIIPMISFPVTFVAGFLVEKIKVHYLFAGSFLGQILVMAVLLNADSIPMAMAFGVVRGIVEGVEVTCMGIIWPNYFGRLHLGSIRGMVMATIVVGSAFGPLPFGMAFDLFGGYKEIIIFMMLFPLLAAVASLISPAPQKVRKGA